MTARATSTAINRFRRPAPGWRGRSEAELLRIDARELKGRHQTKEAPASEPEQDGDRETCPIDGCQKGDRNAADPHRRHGAERIRSPECERRADKTAAQGEQDALGQEQPADVPGSGAEREAHGHFLASRARAREDQVCGVAAHRQEEQQRDRLEDGQRGGKQALRSPGRFPERQDLGSHAGVGLGKRNRQLTHGRVQFRLCGCTSGAWREPAEHCVLATAAIVDLTRAVEQQRCQRHGEPHVERQAHHGALKAAWRDADNRQVLAVDAEGAPDRVCGQSESRLPVVVRDHDDRVAPSCRSLPREGTVRRQAPDPAQKSSCSTRAGHCRARRGRIRRHRAAPCGTPSGR